MLCYSLIIFKVLQSTLITKQGAHQISLGLPWYMPYKGRCLDCCPIYIKEQKKFIKMILECIYDLEFSDALHFCSCRGFHIFIRRIKKVLGETLVLFFIQICLIYPLTTMLLMEFKFTIYYLRNILLNFCHNFVYCSSVLLCCSSSCDPINVK